MLQRVRLVDQVAAVLREGIITGQYGLGQRLNQVELAAELGISRTPLREALRKLEQEGLVRHVNGLGAEVVQLSVQEVLDLYDVREMVDGLSARRLAQIGAEDRLADLRALLVRMEQLVPAQDLSSWERLNTEFHETIVQLAGNQYLIRLVPAIRLSIATFDSARRRTPDLLERALNGHRRVIEAIAAGDQDRAEREARHHVRSGREIVLRHAENLELQTQVRSRGS